MFWFGMGRDGRSTSSAGSDMDVSLNTIGVASDQLRTTLQDLGVNPAHIYGKMMSRSDRDKQQNRFQMSCKSWCAAYGPFPLDVFMTEEEKVAAHSKLGLEVVAFDRAGAQYEGMLCRLLKSNSSYRIIGEWSKFLKQNGLIAEGAGNWANEVLIDLWLFRSGGKLGIVFIHYRKGDAAHADAAFIEEEMEYEEEDEDVGGDDVIVEDGVATMKDGATAGDGIVMEDAAYDAVTENEEEATLPSSDAIRAAPVEEETGSKGEAAVIMILQRPSNHPHRADGTHYAADGPTNEEEAGAQGNVTSSPSSSNADSATAVQVHAPLLSDDAGAKEEETAAPGKAAEPELLGYKSDELVAARMLMRMSQGVR